MRVNRASTGWWPAGPAEAVSSRLAGSVGNESRGDHT